MLSKSASPLLVDGGELSAGFTSTHLRLALLDGAIEHLGSQQLKQLTSSLDEQREAAMRSSVPGVEYDAAAKLTIDGVSAAAGEFVTLDGGKSTPLWPTVYWCLRCGDLAAANRVLRKAATMPAGGGPISWSALQTLASALASVNSANAVSVPTFAKMISDARAEYWASEAQPANQWRSVIYSVLCAPEPQAKLEALMPSNHELTIEEWLWHRLCMVRAQLIEEAPSAALASSHQPLVGLQSLYTRD